MFLTDDPDEINRLKEKLLAAEEEVWRLKQILEEMKKLLGY